MINYFEFKELMLKNFKDEWVAEADILRLYKFFERYDYSKEDCAKIINGARKKIILSQNGYVKFSDQKNMQAFINEIIETADLSLLIRLSNINNRFVSYFREAKIKPTNITITIRKIWSSITKANNDVNNSLADFSEHSIQMLEQFASLYEILTNHIVGDASEERQRREFINAVDDIMINRINTVGKYISKIDDQQLKNVNEFLIELKNSQTEEEAFNSDEIVDLLQHTPSVLSYASKEKLEGIRVALKKHIDNVNNKYNVKLDLEKFSSKKIILTAGSLLNRLPSNIDFASSLLTGNSVDVALQSQRVDIEDKKETSIFAARKYVLLKMFGDLKIEDVDLDFNKRMLSRNLTAFSNLSPTNIYNSLDGLSYCLCEALGGEKSENFRTRVNYLSDIGIDVGQIITKDNLIPLLSLPYSGRGKKDYSHPLAANLIKNTALMSKILQTEDLEKLIKHNLNFLIQPTEEMKARLADIAKVAKTIEELRDGIENYVNENISSAAPQNKVPTTTKNKTSNKRGPKAGTGMQRGKVDVQDIIADEAFLKELGFTEKINKNAMPNKTKVPNVKHSNEKNELDILVERIENNDFEPTPEEFEPADEAIERSKYEEASGECIKMLQYILYSQAENVAQEFNGNVISKMVRNVLEMAKERNDFECYKIIIYYVKECTKALNNSLTQMKDDAAVDRNELGRDYQRTFDDRKRRIHVQKRYSQVTPEELTDGILDEVEFETELAREEAEKLRSKKERYEEKLTTIDIVRNISSKLNSILGEATQILGSEKSELVKKKDNIIQQIKDLREKIKKLNDQIEDRTKHKESLETNDRKRGLKSGRKSLLQALKNQQIPQKRETLQEREKQLAALEEELKQIENEINRMK